MKRLLISLIAIALCCTTLSAQQTRRKVLKKFDRVLELIEDNYVEDKPLEPMVEEAIRATLRSLDPHSQYLTKEEMKAANRRLRGKFAGIGIQYIIHNDTLVVSSVIEGSPAQEAGITYLDRILAVDDNTIIGCQTDSISSLMHGDAGSKISLTLLSSGNDNPTTINLKRANIRTSAVVALRIDSVGYIALSTFTKSAASEFYKAYTELGDVKSLVVDLRDNGGGYLSAAIDLSSLFLSKRDVILITENSKRQKVYDTRNEGVLRDLPLVVVINESTASSSEIFAGAIQDHDRGTIIGRTSFGKGLIQKNIEFNDGSGVRITTERYMTPSGRPIQRPYTAGKNVAYLRDSSRYMHPDSIHRDTTHIFRTLKLGREVYGSGGITPDIYIGADSTKLSKCVKESLLNSIFEHCAVEFFRVESMEHIREEHPTMYSFNEKYTLSPELWDILYRIGGYGAEDITETDRHYLETMLYATLAEKIYGIEARYYINISRFDSIAQQAIAIAEESIAEGVSNEK